MMAKLYWRVKRNGKWTWTAAKFKTVNWWHTKDTLKAVIYDPKEEEEE
tara:strand:+ start:619 stop:762 length:144 start_codon:yes stop_codon:yes gene_type:complete